MRNPLKLPNFRRNPDRPSLKQRAAALKATAARVLRRPSPPVHTPPPGSPEAVTAFHAACSEFDRRTRINDAEYERLRINGGPCLWTSEKVSEAIDGRAPSASLSRGDLQELLVVTLRRELAMQEALRDLRLNELFEHAFPNETAPAEAALGNASGTDPRLAAMVAEMLEARRKLNDPSVPDGPEADALGERETHLSIEIHRFPAQSIHDMRAKLPLLREEAEDAARGWDSKRVPFEESLPGAAWAGLLRDIEHLAGAAPAAQIAPDPILAAIEASKVAHAARDAWAQRFNGGTKLTAADFAEEDDLNGVQSAAHEAVLSTVPASAAGRLALLEYLRWQMGLYGMADGSPPDAGSAFWPDAYRALKAALAFEGSPQEPAARSAEIAAAPKVRAGDLPSPGGRDLSREAFDYAWGLDLSAVPFSNLCRLYEVFHAAHELLWPVENGSMFDEGTHKPCRAHTAGGAVLDAEINRVGCLRDAMARELRSRRPASENQRNARLEVLIAHEIRCERKIRNKDLLAEINQAWGA